MSIERLRHFIPFFALKLASSRLRRIAPPLLEEKGHALLKGLIAKLDNPLLVDRPALGAGLPTHDDPVDAGQVYLADWPYQGFERNEADRRWHLPEVVNSLLVAGVLHRHPYPDVFRPRRQLGGKLGEPLVPLGQHLVDMPGRFPHHLEDLLQKVERHFLVEEVAHGVDKDQARLSPPARLIQALRVQGELKSMREVIGKALRDALSVAMFAARAHFCAARGRVPRFFRPFNSRARACHLGKPYHTTRLSWVSKGGFYAPAR